MQPKIKPQTPNLRLLYAIPLLFLPILISALSCSIPIADQAQKETDIAQDVQATLNAQKIMTLESQQTVILTQQATSDFGGVIREQQATISAQSTTLTESDTPVAPSDATDTPQAQTIVLLDWKATGQWAEVTNCPYEGVCWTDSPMGNYGNKRETTLASTDSIYIDPAWASPFLVFWMKLDLEPGYDVASVDIRTEESSTWKEISFFKNYLGWSEVYISLAKYKGQKVSFRFRLYSDDLLNKDGWYLQHIRVEPDYNP